MSQFEIATNGVFFARMSPAWLDQWLDKPGNVLRRAKVDVEKASGGGGASLDDLRTYIQKKGAGQWSLLETLDEYVVLKAPAPVLVTHLGSPTLT